MATVDKNFRIKHGLVVEGSTGTINGNNILTENASDQYIINLIGGQATSESTPNAVVKRDSNGNFASNQIIVNAISLNGTDVETELSGLQSSKADIVYVDDQVANAINSANAYTDSAISTEVTNRNFAIQSAKNDAEDYADTAASNALNSANSYTDGQVSNAINTASQYAAGAQAAAESYADSLAINYDPAGAAANAQSNAEGYTDSAISTEVTNRNSAIATAKSQAISEAEGYTDDAIATEVTARNSAINTAKSEAEQYADNAASQAQSAAEAFATNAANTALSSANSYTDTSVANLVNNAPAMLDTLKELADAIADNPNYASDVANLVSTKADTTYVDSQDAATLSSAESYTDSAISTEVSNRNSAISSAISTEVSNRNSAIQSAVNDVENYADTAAANAENAAKSYADSLAPNYDAAGSATTAENNAKSYADNLVASGDANAEPTYKGVKLGYYTEMVSGWADTTTGASFVPLTWNTNYGTAKLVVHVRSGVHTQASELLIARDSSNNLHLTEYAIVTTNGSLADVSATVSGSTVSLVVTPTAGHNVTEAVASGQLMVWAD